MVMQLLRYMVCIWTDYEKEWSTIMKYTHILFDLDGTLTDPKEGICTSVQYALKAFGIDEPDIEKLTPFIGPPLKDSFMNFYGFNEVQAEETIAKYREWFKPKGIFQNAVYPGIPKMLRELKGSGKVLAVASSKPQVFVEQILEHFEIRDYFAVVVGSELDGTRGRKEEVVEEALRQLGKAANPQNTVMVGDRCFDIQGGKQYGLVTAGVTFGYAKEGELDEAGADFVVDTVEELGRLLVQ